MSDIFEMLGASEGATQSLLAALIIEPTLQLVGFVAFIIVSFRHYRKTGSKGALIIFISLLISIVNAIITEIVFSYTEDNVYNLIEILFRIADATLFPIMVWGFYLVCREQSTLGNH